MATKTEDTVAPVTQALEATTIAEKQPETTPAAAPTATEDTKAAAEVADKKAEETVAEPEKKEAIAEPEKKEAPATTEAQAKEQEATGAVAAAPVPAPTEPTESKELKEEEDGKGPVWPETPAEHPLTKFYACFEELVKDSGYDEVYGITLSKDEPFHTKLILQKFLRANANDLQKAKDQLLDTLKWRKAFKPQEAAEASYTSVFEGLGYITELEGVPDSPNKVDIVTFNIYGAVKDNKATFGDVDGFLKWRFGLMEKSVQKLKLKEATQPIPNFGEGPDPYQGYQVHDYLQVSFIRQDPMVKAASKKVIEVLGRHYPETLSRKFFVNVPVLMGWVYQAIKLVVAKETAKKFTVLSYGNQLAAEIGPNIPKEYGGNAGELKDIGEAMNTES